LTGQQLLPPVAELVHSPCCCCSTAKQPFYYDVTPATRNTGIVKIPALTPANLYSDLNIRSAKQPCYYDPSGILAPWLGKCAVNPVWFAAQKAHSKGAKADVLQVRNVECMCGYVGVQGYASKAQEGALKAAEGCASGKERLPACLPAGARHHFHVLAFAGLCAAMSTQKYYAQAGIVYSTTLHRVYVLCLL
jgi:hypothetical protein